MNQQFFFLIMKILIFELFVFFILKNKILIYYSLAFP